MTSAPTDLSVRSTPGNTADATRAAGGTSGYGVTGIADTGLGTATYGNTDISGYRSSNTDTYGGKRRTGGFDVEPNTRDTTTSTTSGGGGGSSNAFDISGLTTGTRGYTGSAYDAGRTANVSSVRAAKGGGVGAGREGDTGFGYGSGWRNTFDVGNAGNTEETGYGSRADYRR